ncbi:hypothetical protein [Burkholderia alba]|uniref:hypothetical protein n=1 Tax=Burkholderia alba TaxID=2683677 RepID=UPI002B05990C|nr:hypothetical protein [Burkholderia alba]
MGTGISSLSEQGTVRRRAFGHFGNSNYRSIKTEAWWVSRCGQSGCICWKQLDLNATHPVPDDAEKQEKQPDSASFCGKW